MSFRQEIAKSTPKAAELSDEQWLTLESFVTFCPVYKRFLGEYPESVEWLFSKENLNADYRYAAFKENWDQVKESNPLKDRPFLEQLHHFRRKMSMRIALREFLGIGHVEKSLNELTLLAEFCLKEVYQIHLAKWNDSLSQSKQRTLEELGQFCILGLGKLGAEELNFYSDLDLILIYSPNAQSTEEALLAHSIFHKFSESLLQQLQATSKEGMLYPIDLRLRPGGSGSALALKPEAIINHCGTLGQIWERIAWMRARPICGNLELGEDLLESLNPFCYPKSLPKNSLDAVSGLKVRTEQEVLLSGKNLEEDIKSGHGGIREIEFLVQCEQLFLGSQNPFLKTNNTLKAIEKIGTYRLLSSEICQTLKNAYSFLRRVENLLQIQNETPCHHLPTDKKTLIAIGNALGFENPSTFQEKLKTIRQAVHNLYKEKFNPSHQEIEIQEWIQFATGSLPSKDIHKKIKTWFPEILDAEQKLKLFLRNESHQAVTREQIQLFLSLSELFEPIFPHLADPLEALTKVGTFANTYGARSQFFKTFSLNPNFFESLLRLFDRSDYSFKLLCQYPEIIDELLHQPLGRQKSVEDFKAEIQRLNESQDFVSALKLYMRAEQTRFSMAEVLKALTLEEVEIQLATLADAILAVTLETLQPEDKIGIIALGKYGSCELSIGADLDLMLITEKTPDPSLIEKSQEWIKKLNQSIENSPLYNLDLRLRPFGEGGPLLISLDSLNQYHQNSGFAQPWERQMLTKARCINRAYSGHKKFEEWRLKLLYSNATPKEQIESIWEMRIKAAQTHCKENTDFSLQKSPGGLMDYEFLAQTLQLLYGNKEPSLRDVHPDKCFEIACKLGFISQESQLQLSQNYKLIKKLQFILRGQSGSSTQTLPKDIKEQNKLKKWLGIKTQQTLEEYLKNRAENGHKCVKNILSESFQVTYNLD